MTPSEFGISVLRDLYFVAIAEAIRELGSTAYLVQQKELTQSKIRTVFTVSLLVTLTMSIVLLVSSGPIARFYSVPELARYIQIIALWLLRSRHLPIPSTP